MIGIATLLSLISAKVILIPNRSNDSLIGKEVTVNFPHIQQLLEYIPGSVCYFLGHQAQKKKFVLINYLVWLLIFKKHRKTKYQVKKKTNAINYFTSRLKSKSFLFKSFF